MARGPGWASLSGMPSAPLPAALTEGAFTLAMARAAGESCGSLRRRGLASITHGVRSAEELAAHQRLAALLLVLPPAVAFSHVTAADLHGLPLTKRQQTTEGVHLMRPSASAQTRRPGLIGHRGLEWRKVVEREGLPVVDAADTWCDFGELIRRDRLTIDDLVVVGDAAANVILRPERTAYDFSDVRPEWWESTSLDDRLARRCDALRTVREVLNSRLSNRVRPRGKASLMQALALIRSGVRSPMETRARLMFVHDGLPEPHVNLDIYSDEGQWLAEGDLVWPGAKVVGEYQGVHHADRAQASKDAQKRSLLRDHGWRTREIWAEDLFEWERRKALLARFRTLLDG